MAGLRLITGTPQALEQTLSERIAAIQAGDPLAPIGVLLGGTLQRPYLQRRLAERNGGIANVRFLMPSELALELGERAMLAEGRRPLPPLADRVLLREIAVELDGYFAPVRETPGLGDALHRLVRELRGAGYDADSFAAALAGACEVPAKEEALRQIFSEFLRRRARFYGPDDCLLAADTANPAWRALFAYGPWQPPAALTRALVALSRTIPVSVLVATSGREELDAAHEDLRAALIEAGAEAEELPAPAPRTTLDQARARLFTVPDAPAEPDGTVRLLSGPDPAREIREVARQCLAWAREGIAFHEMAVAYRHPDPYRSLIASTFNEARIPVYLHEGSPMSERPLGRRVIALLELVGGDLARRDVLDFLSDGRLPEQTRERFGEPSVSQWDRYSRRAGVVRGLGEWETRLARQIEALRASDREWEREDAERVEQLLAFIRELARDLGSYPERGAWSEHMAYLRRLLTRYVDGPEPILDALAGLERFDALDEETTFERFRQVVVGAIQSLRSDEVEGGRPGAFGLRGVNVLDVNSLRHLSFRAVAIVGVAERSFPSPPSPDPILLDHERERLNERGPAPVPLRVRGADPEPLQFLVAAHAARERLLVSYPRKGGSEGRPQLPSRFFRAVAEAVVGGRVSADQVDELPAGLYTRAQGNRMGAADPGLALSLHEYDRSVLERDLPLGRALLGSIDPRFDRALAARRARASGRLTEFDGVLGERARALLGQIFDPLARGASPSMLEDYAACPHRVLIGEVFRIRIDEEPEETVRLSALDRGSLIHRVLERFLSEETWNGEPRLTGPSEEERLLAIAREEFDAAEAEGKTGMRAFWEQDRDELVDDLRTWLAREREDELATALAEGAYEVSFGYRERGSGSDAGLSSAEPVEVSAGGVRLAVAGRIDRVNWDPGRGRFRVIDYKTGSDSRMPGDGSLAGGTALQLPLYLLAAAKLLGIDPARGLAEYHYATRRGRFSRSRFDGADLAERKADLEALLGRMLDGMRSGFFPMAIANARDCTYCAASGLCPTNRMRLIERKSDDPAFEPIQRIREVE